MLAESAFELVGKTPLLHLNRIEKVFGLKAKIYAKVELFNPTGSVKDRAALSMILDAEEKGLLKEGATIIEPTSGNTGIGIASIAAMKGYQTILVMPESMSLERRKLLKAYGAKLVLTPASKGMAGTLEEAERLNKEIPDSLVLGQFDNPANPAAHYKTTGPEIYEDLKGQVDAFVAGVGTGGTVSGVAKYLKEKNPKIFIAAVEPASSPLLTKGTAGGHAIQGIGANFVPKNLDPIYDEVIDVSNEDAFTYGRLVGKKEGILVGISSGAALSGAISLAKRKEFAGKNIVVLFPDSGDRYLSTALFEE